MLLEQISVDIIYVIVNCLNGCNISKFSNTSIQINTLIKEQKDKIWLKFLCKEIDIWDKCFNLPNQVIFDFHVKTRLVYKDKNINNNYIRYAVHYFCCKYIIIHLRKEILKNYKFINTLIFYGPSLINYLYKNIYGYNTILIDINKVEKSFKNLNKYLLKNLQLKNIDIINTIKNIHIDLFYVSKVLLCVSKSILIMDYIHECFLKDYNSKEINKRFVRRINYLSKLCNICYYRLI
jgi:hypothetical protein